MRPKRRFGIHGELFQPALVDLIDTQHALLKLEALIDWSVFEQSWSALFVSKAGRPHRLG
jgi:hypothetical protein